MRNYCTLFDSKYLPQGLVMIESLQKHSSLTTKIWVLAMDHQCEDVLTRINLHNVIIIDLTVFETAMAIRSLRHERTWTEYCWTCASLLTEYVMMRARSYIPDITYLDADMMFFSNPEAIFDEIGHRSIAIIPHRFIPEKQHLAINGNYNVSWVTFACTESGTDCLETWAAQCRLWCYYKNENGKFADQKYLDEWPAKYGPNLCVIQNLGAGLAPWNLGNEKLGLFGNNQLSIVREVIPTQEAMDFHGSVTSSLIPVVFYHYHEFAELQNGRIRLTNYEISDRNIKLIYKPYMEAYIAAKERVASVA